MYALLNITTNRFFRIENEYRICIEVDTFVEALTFKTIKDAYYKSSFLKEDYRIINIDEARRLNKLF